jgi:predicted small secreted protein
MRRFLPVLALLLLPLLAACSTVGTALLGRDIAFTAPQLQSQLNRNFPRDYSKLGGLVSLSLLNPRLSLTGGGRLQLEFDLGVGAMGAQSRSPSGRFALQSGLRFDTRTLGLHLDRPEIVSVDVPKLGGAMNDTARSMLNSWLLDYARQEPVYRLDQTALGRLASRRIQRVDIDPGTVTLRLD